MTDWVDSHTGAVRSFFASPERASEPELQHAIECVSNNEIIDGVMQSIGGLIAILNEQRQILSVNESFLQYLGIENDVGELLGLRPGEAIGCVHANDMPDGCGTSKFCRSCGAAIAIVTSLAEGAPSEQDCIAEAIISGQRQDLFLRVRAVPMNVKGLKLILLFLQDATDDQRRASLERTFFHDIGNIIGSLVGTADLLESDDQVDSKKLTNDLLSLSVRLGDEFKIQRLITDSEAGSYRPKLKPVKVETVLNELKSLFSNDQVAIGKSIQVFVTSQADEIETDISLLYRVLSNMVRNALEASEVGDEIRLWIESDDLELRFCVWNRQYIPKNIALRIFQRNFSDKDEAGRGLGTFSMKMLSEQFLNGKVDFTTSITEGTTFRLHLPR